MEAVSRETVWCGCEMSSVILVLMLLLVPARGGVRVEFFAFRPGWEAVWAGRCVSDAAGRCEMHVRVPEWADGLVRGELRWDGGVRPLIAPGEEMTLRLEAPGERRYDYLPAGTAAPPIGRGQKVWWLGAAALVLGWSVWMYRRQA